MNKTKFLIASTVFIAAFSISAEAKLYKWVDKNGTTHYGETIPPEYADRDTKELNKGRVIDRSETFDSKLQEFCQERNSRGKSCQGSAPPR